MSPKTESGRSMVEMLGVLAIVGVLSVVGVMGLRSALDSAKANKLIQALSRRTTVLAADKSFGTNFTDNTSFGQDSDYTITCTDVPNSPLFSCTVSTVPQNVCQKILKMNWELPLRMSPQTCNQTNDMVYVFGEGEAQEKTTACTTDAECTPQATCTEGVCVEPPLKSCDTNVENPCGDECQTCNPTTLLCENACTRKQYLQSDGGQWMNTGIVPTDDTQIETKFYFTSGVFGKTGSEYQYLNGVTSGGRMAWGYAAGQSTSQVYVGIANVNSSTTGCQIALNTDYHLIFDGHGNISCNGNSKQIDVGHNSQPNPIHLFARKTATSNKNHPFSGGMYFVKISQNGSLVRDFVPVRSPTNKACMYDKVTQSLFCNQGTGDFLTD